MIPLLMKEQSPVSFKCHLNRPIHSFFVEKGTGSNQIFVVGSMVGLLLLLMIIVGVVLLFIMLVKW